MSVPSAAPPRLLHLVRGLLPAYGIRMYFEAEYSTSLPQRVVARADSDCGPETLDRRCDALMESVDEHVPGIVVAHVAHRPLVERCDRGVSERGLFDVLPCVVGADWLRDITQLIEVVEPPHASVHVQRFDDRYNDSVVVDLARRLRTYSLLAAVRARSSFITVACIATSLCPCFCISVLVGHLWSRSRAMSPRVSLYSFSTPIDSMVRIGSRVVSMNAPVRMTRMP